MSTPDGRLVLGSCSARGPTLTVSCRHNINPRQTEPTGLALDDSPANVRIIITYSKYYMLYIIYVKIYYIIFMCTCEFYISVRPSALVLPKMWERKKIKGYIRVILIATYPSSYPVMCIKRNQNMNVSGSREGYLKI